MNEEEDGSVPAEPVPERCTAMVPNGSLHQCQKPSNHPYAHLATVKDTTYSWGDMGYLYPPKDQQ